MLELEKALDTLENIARTSDKYLVKTIPQISHRPSMVMKRETYGEDNFYAFPAQHGEWGIMVEVYLPSLRKELWISRRFEKALIRFRKRSGIPMIELHGPKIFGAVFAVNPLTDPSFIFMQRLNIYLALQNFVNSQAKKMKLGDAFDSEDF